VAEDQASGRLMGSCFYHPRQTHVSLGIMNVHVDFAGRGVASRLLRFITDLADRQAKPLRLVSSAMNLDSFSLYTRAGFVPRAAFADMQIPADLAAQLTPPVLPRHQLREATVEDAGGMVDLEFELSGICREKDFAHFIEDRRKIWRTIVAENPAGGIDGFLVSVAHPGSTMLGPGCMRDEDLAAALIADHLRHHAGFARAPVFLMPLDHPALQRRIYQWGGRNLEIHFTQVRGAFSPFAGIVMPTFMPETA
jgi:predicted N-acetyltransferase YhbS